MNVIPSITQAIDGLPFIQHPPPVCRRLLCSFPLKPPCGRLIFRVQVTRPGFSADMRRRFCKAKGSVNGEEGRGGE